MIDCLFLAKGKTVDATQEMLALGLCNIFGSFFQSMPVTGSFTRTAVNNASGVQTTLGGIVTGILVLLSLGFLTESFRFIPKTTLAAVIICAMIGMVDLEEIREIWRSKRMFTQRTSRSNTGLTRSNNLICKFFRFSPSRCRYHTIFLYFSRLLDLFY